MGGVWSRAIFAYSLPVQRIRIELQLAGFNIQYRADFLHLMYLCLHNTLLFRIHNIRTHSQKERNSSSVFCVRNYVKQDYLQAHINQRIAQRQCSVICCSYLCIEKYKHKIYGLCTKCVHLCSHIVIIHVRFVFVFSFSIQCFLDANIFVFRFRHVFVCVSQYCVCL